MKHKIALYFSSFILFGFLFVAADATAQTIAYRQTNLSSNLPNVANNVTPGLVNPWGIAFLSDQPFFIADNKVGRVTVHDASGLGVGPGGFIVPNATRTGFDTPTGIVADQNSFFGGQLLLKIGQLGAVGQLALPQQINYFFVAGFAGQVMNVDAAISQDTVGAVHGGQRGLRSNDAGSPGASVTSN